MNGPTTLQIRIDTLRAELIRRRAFGGLPYRLTRWWRRWAS